MKAIPNRAKSVIQAGGQLELHLVLDTTPYPSEAAAMAAHGGVLPPERAIGAGQKFRLEHRPAGPESWYVIDRVPVVTGRDLRSATAVRSTENPGFYDVDFTLSTEAGRRFGPFTEQNIGKQLGIVLEHQAAVRAGDQRPHRRHGRDRRANSASRKPTILAWSCAPGRSPHRSNISKSAP